MRDAIRVRIDKADYDFYPGGHGPMWDLAESPASIALLEAFYNSGKPIALVRYIAHVEDLNKIPAGPEPEKA